MSDINTQRSANLAAQSRTQRFGNYNPNATSDTSLWVGRLEVHLRAIRDERKRQLNKWSVQKHDLPTWIAILSEEVGELSELALQAKFDPLNTPQAQRLTKRIEREAHQIAAVGAAIAQYIRWGEA